VLRAFAPDWWRQRRRLVFSYTFGLLAAGTAVLQPWPLKFLIDNVLGSHPLPTWLADISTGWSTEILVIVLALAVGVIGIAGTLFSAFEKLINARVREGMTADLRKRTLEHIQTLPLSYRTTDLSGELVLRIVDDAANLVRMYCHTAAVLFRHLAIVVATFAAMFWLEPLFGLIGLVAVTALASITLYYARPLRRASRRKRQREGEVAGLAQEIVRGLASTQALGAESRVGATFAGVNASSLEAGVREIKVSVAMERAMGLAKGIAFTLIVGAGALMVVSGDLTIGSLTVGAAYLSQLFRPIAKINELASSITRALARGEQLLSLFQRRTDIRDPEDPVEMERSTGRLELREVSFSYPAPGSGAEVAPVLRDVSFRLEPGSFTVVLGPSGSGKSTLLSLLLRLFDPSAGEILLDGVPVSRLRLKQLRAQFGVMLQEIHLFAGPLRESLLPVDQKVSDDDMWRVLSQVAMDEFVAALPGGLEANLGENGVNLSGGQRARLSLARALLTDSTILLLDEPLANVDPASQRIILDALAEVRGERTCLVVTHQLALTELADSVLQLSGHEVETLSDVGDKAKRMHAR
jgi:ABC-type multidrug transport system fused ATPase/permease subunit